MEEWLNPHRMIEVMEGKGHVVFREPEGYNLNIVGVRTSDMTANRFNDWIAVFYKYDDNWNFFAFPATTDPGTYWRTNPMFEKGTAILKPGQYRGVYRIGLHKRFKALVQCGDLTVYRDANRDERIDVTGATEETRNDLGINIHRTYGDPPPREVGKWSAGCQVLQDTEHLKFLLALCEKQVVQLGARRFTYTLLQEDDFA